MKKSLFELLQELNEVNAELKEIQRPDSEYIARKTAEIFPAGVALDEQKIRDAIKNALAN